MQLADMQPRVGHVLIETSGVALPGQVAGALTLLQGFALDAVVTMVDAGSVRAQAADAYLADTSRAARRRASRHPQQVRSRGCRRASRTRKLDRHTGAARRHRDGIAWRGAAGGGAGARSCQSLSAAHTYACARPRRRLCLAGAGCNRRPRRRRARCRIAGARAWPAARERDRARAGWFPCMWCSLRPPRQHHARARRAAPERSRRDRPRGPRRPRRQRHARSRTAPFNSALSAFRSRARSSRIEACARDFDTSEIVVGPVHEARKRIQAATGRDQ